ncbi:MAG: hypothetical protein COA90_00525 [Gammaproteobacteria bacterium]|nr:MAG: hypothetical protein COA90_00525 [Gammaproteobacteria bacterium]
MKNKSTLWYTRQNGIINGPFSPSVIKDYISLNRLKVNHDEISSDQLNWHLIKQQADESINLHQLDERNGFDRRHPNKSIVRQSKSPRQDRRAGEEDTSILRRQFRTLLMNKFRNKQADKRPLLILFLASCCLLAIIITYSTPFPSTSINCDAPAHEKVNWSNCFKPKLNLPYTNFQHALLRSSQMQAANFEGSNFNHADLAYSNLKFSNLSYSQLNNSSLIGANLKSSNLSYANLTNADLSYANLTDVNLTTSNLKNTRFDHAIWTDGKQCLANSIGQCITLKIPD